MASDSQKRLVQKWIEALESGEYPQTTYSLHNQEGYCCLGVLCEVAGIRSRIESPTTGWYIFGPFPDGTSDGELPPDTWFYRVTGFDSEFKRKLAEMNDDENKSFKEIAQRIREELSSKEAEQLKLFS